MSEETVAVDGRTPWHLWLVGILGTLWNSVGAFDYFATQTQNEAYLSNFSPEQLAFFHGLPVLIVACWALAVWGGVLGTILLLFKTRHAVSVLLVSFVSMVITAFHNFVLSNGLEIMGGGGAAFSALIFVAALGLWIYARAMKGKGALA